MPWRVSYLLHHALTLQLNNCSVQSEELTLTTEQSRTVKMDLVCLTSRDTVRIMAYAGTGKTYTFLGNLLLQTDVEHAGVHVLGLIQQQHVMPAGIVLQVRGGQVEQLHKYTGWLPCSPVTPSRAEAAEASHSPSPVISRLAGLR